MKIYLYTRNRKLLGSGKIAHKFKSHSTGFKIDFFFKNPIYVCSTGTLNFFELWESGDEFIHRGKFINEERLEHGDTIFDITFDMLCEVINEVSVI